MAGSPISRETTATSKYYPKVTKADANLPDGICRALHVGTAGTANLMDATGAIRADFPLKAGQNNVQCLQVRTGGTADDIWALY